MTRSAKRARSWAAKADARADGELDLLQDLLRLLPLLEEGSLIRPDHEGGVSEATVAHRIDGERVRVELDLRIGKGGFREPKTGSASATTLRCPGCSATRTTSRSSGTAFSAGLGQLDMTVVRRVERAAEEADHASSTTSSPIATSSPSFAPAALSASASSSSPGGRPTTRKPVSVRKMR